MQTVVAYFERWVEDCRRREGSRWQALWLPYANILLLSIRGFQEDRCQLRASALTLYTLLSVVPVMAMAFGIAKGFGFEQRLERQLIARIPAQEEGLLYIFDFARKLLENTQGGLIAGIGVAFLFWSVIKVLSHIESSFNHIWKIREARSLGRKFSDYLSLMVIGPILVIIASSVSVFISTQVTLFTKSIELLEVFSPFILFSLRLLPYGIIWILFSFLYIFLPNTRVRFWSGVFGGIIAGTIYQLVQIGYIYFQVKIANYNAIYGSFAALPFFVMWLQLSWLVVLFGAEISFYHHHIDTYACHDASASISPYVRTVLALRVAHLLVRNFAQGQPPLTTDQMLQTLKFPPLLLSQSLTDLVESGIVAPVAEKGGDGEVAYQPAKALNLLTVKAILDALYYQGVQELPLPHTAEVEALQGVLQQFEQAVEASPANVLLKDIPEAETERLA
ncbi:YihY family inner membrane protein [candidate division KSB3 bacterium]|uniref:YihY family inner membrane protein n=1 Tax=candidate division KSB3 bacterium TaxID=2044937 RepID=A0A9D5K0H0_9BACT|nr:YihY family inner membrane protein [candidate division KSB3 bacterium]MBD3327535.1 YihY family inner membrane protein [candidate division KSB3 bacterium]